MANKTFNPQLSDLIKGLEKESGLIPEERRAELAGLASLIKKMKRQEGFAKVIFICTHNSRRSQLAQLWLKTAAFWHGVHDIYTYSGGTEATAFNHRMVAALKRAGFDVRQLDKWDNPKYHIPVSEEDKTLDIYYSKEFSDSYNPDSNFIAVMVCNEADDACPYVHGAAGRLSLPYIDPKMFDNSEMEERGYDDKVMEIGMEMLYAAKQLKDG